jgi:hypothetical protein
MVEIPALTPLENPGVHHGECAITEEHDGAGIQRAPDPPHKPPQ